MLSDIIVIFMKAILHVLRSVFVEYFLAVVLNSIVTSNAVDCCLQCEILYHLRTADHSLIRSCCCY